MRKLILAALSVVLAVAVVPAATATASKTVTVSITSAAFVPRSVSVEVGDYVKWTNNSTATQQVACPKCSFKSPALPAGGTYTHRFTTAGTFGITDTQNKKINGSVTVTAAPQGSVTLTSAPTAAKYGTAAVLSGTISSGMPNQNVTILSKESGQAGFTRLATTTTGTGGTYSVTQTPSVNTSYEATWAKATSAAVRVFVQPRIALARVARQRFRVSIRAAMSLVGKTVQFQMRTARGTWVKVKRVTLKTALATGSATTITKAAFRSKLRHGKRVRILLSNVQAAPHYVSARSNIVKS